MEGTMKESRTAIRLTEPGSARCGSAPANWAPLITVAPTDDHPDLLAYTVTAVMVWVNQCSGAERDERLARVLSIVRPSA